MTTAPPSRTQTAAEPTPPQSLDAPAEPVQSPGGDPPSAGPDTDRQAPIPAPASTPEAQPSASGLLPQQLTSLAGVLAPITLLGALLYYFGWMHAYSFFSYFGVHSTVLGLTTQDYIQRSVDGVFVPMTVVACVALAGGWGHAVLRARLEAGSGTRVLRALPSVATLGGLALAGIGLASVIGKPIVSEPAAVAPLSLAVGVPLVVYAARLRGSLRAKTSGAERAARVTVAEWVAVFVLVGLSLFWAATDYASAVGESRARRFVATLPSQPDAVLYSAESLSLRVPGVSELRCQDPNAAYRFRYDGLKLVLQSGDQYVFLPGTWSPDDGAAVVIPRSDTLRLEFVLASAAHRLTC